MRPAYSTLTICGIEELEAHAGRGVTHVLSIVDPGTPEPPAFASYAGHRRVTLRFHDIIEPDPDFTLPGRADVEAILAWGRELDAATPGHLLVHCHMGISRSTAAMTMLLAQAHPDEAEQSVADHVRAVRPVAWPNLRMIELADALLGRGGRLTAAVATLYARSLAARPDLAEVMTRFNRAREVDLGRATSA